MKGTLRSVDHGTYVMHEITMPSGAGARVCHARRSGFRRCLGRPVPARLSASAGPVLCASRTSAASRRQHAATATRPDCASYAGPGVPAKRTHAQLSRSSLHSTINAARRPGQRYPLRETTIVRKLWLLLVAGKPDSDWLPAAAAGGSSTITSVTVSCSPSTVMSGQTSQCSATVIGNRQLQFGCDVDGERRHDLDVRLVYCTIRRITTLQVTVTATSTQDTSKSGTATVTVNPARSR